MEKKRFILFGFLSYYPSGGMSDALISFDTLEELIKESYHFECDYYNILDTKHFKVGRGYSPTIAFSNLASE